MLGDGRRSPAPSAGRRLPDPVQVWEEAPPAEEQGGTTLAARAIGLGRRSSASWT